MAAAFSNMYLWIVHVELARNFKLALLVQETWTIQPVILASHRSFLHEIMYLRARNYVLRRGKSRCVCKLHRMRPLEVCRYAVFYRLSVCIHIMYSGQMSAQWTLTQCACRWLVPAHAGQWQLSAVSVYRSYLLVNCLPDCELFVVYSFMMR